jgi:hypothetical protein
MARLTAHRKRLRVPAVQRAAAPLLAAVAGLLAVAACSGARETMPTVTEQVTVTVPASEPTTTANEEPAPADTATALIDCLTGAAVAVYDHRTDPDLKYIVVDFGSYRPTVYLWLGEDADRSNLSNLFWEPDESTPVYLGEGVLEAWFWAHIDDEPAAMDACYTEAGLVPPDRSAA